MITIGIISERTSAYLLLSLAVVGKLVRITLSPTYYYSMALLRKFVPHIMLNLLYWDSNVEHLCAIVTLFQPS